MPFGLCNAPATFERLMEKVLGQLQWQILLCYLDDILIFSKTVSQHFDHLRAVLQRLREARLKLKPKKCHFFCQQVTFLGHVVSQDGVSTDPDKIKKVKECPSPKDVHEVRSVIGLMSYYRRFMPHFSEVAKPLIKLTEKDQVFQWQSEQEEAFQKLKELLITAPVLVHPRTEGLFILDTDASNEGIGAVLSQIQDDEEKVVAYASKTLSKTERNYCITRRELLAVVQFVTQFKHFLLGRKFLVRTDNSAVRYWMKIHSDTYDPQGQTARWLVKLSAYDFEIKHRPGSQHSNADGLSRAPFIRCAQCELRHEDAFRTKRVKTVTVSSKDASTQTVGCKRSNRNSVTDTCQQKRSRMDEQTGRPSFSRMDEQTSRPSFSKEGEKVVEAGVDDRVQVRNSSTDSQRNLRGLASEARVLTRGQRQMPFGPKASQGATPSWLEGGVCLDKNVLMDEQLKDPASVDALCWLRQGKRPDREGILSYGLDQKFLWGNFETLIVLDGLLCKRIGPLIDGTVKTTVYVPPSLRKEVLKQCHDTKTAGHFYFWKTLGKVKKYFTWGGINKDVQIYCKACQVCATKKTAGRHQKAEMRRYDVGLPMEEVAIDLMGPYPESEDGNKYVLVIVDSFSKWMEAYPVPNIEAKTVAERLVMEFFSRFGVPLQIKSDRGRQFDCALFEEMCTLLDIEHRMSTPFHPQGNSRVERMVKVVGNLISAFCQTYKEWDKNLPLLTLAYRSTVHEVTGFTPNYIMTGREVSLPLDVMLGSIRDRDETTVPGYVERLKYRLQGCFEEVRQHLKQFGERQKRYYNLSLHGEQYRPGDLVYLREKTRKKQVSPKLMPKWKGPYVIVKRFGTVYEVMMNLKASKLFHFDLLKPCHIQDVPAWIQKARKKFIASQVDGVKLCRTRSPLGRQRVASRVQQVVSTSGDDADQSQTRVFQIRPITDASRLRPGYIRAVNLYSRPDQLAPDLDQPVRRVRRILQYFKTVQDGSRVLFQDETYRLFERNSSQVTEDDMALRGTEGRLYKWCAICRTDMPPRHKTLRIHLNQAHEMELLPGCPRCRHYRSRWSDVKKHCRTHGVDIDDPSPGDECVWGLTRQDLSSSKPTYSAATEICPYPLREHKFTTDQIRVLAQAKILEPTGQPGPQRAPSGERPQSHKSQSQQPSKSQSQQPSKSQFQRPSKSQPQQPSELRFQQASEPQTSKSQQPSKHVSKSQSHQSKSQSKSQSHRSRSGEHSRKSSSERPRKQSLSGERGKKGEIKRPRTSSPSKHFTVTAKPVVINSSEEEEATGARAKRDSLVTTIVVGDPTMSIRVKKPKTPPPVRFSPRSRKSWNELDISHLSSTATPNRSLLSSLPSTPSSGGSRKSSRVRLARTRDSSSEEDTMHTVSSLEPGVATLDIPILTQPEPEGSPVTPRRSRRKAAPSTSESSAGKPTTVKGSAATGGVPGQHVASSSTAVAASSTAAAAGTASGSSKGEATEVSFIDPSSLSPSTVVVPRFQSVGVQTVLHVEETDVLVALSPFGGRIS